MWICSVADHFRMPSLRIEALSVLCGKATIKDIPLLQEMMDVMNVADLRPCLNALHELKRKHEREALMEGSALS